MHQPQRALEPGNGSSSGATALPPAWPLPLTHGPAQQLPPGTIPGEFLVTLWRLVREQGQGSRETPVSGGAGSLWARQGILWDGLGTAAMSPVQGSLHQLVWGSWGKAQVPQKMLVWREAWSSHCGWWETEEGSGDRDSATGRRGLCTAETPRAVPSPGYPWPFSLPEPLRGWKNPRRHPPSQTLPEPRGCRSPLKGEGAATAAPSHTLTHGHPRADPHWETAPPLPRGLLPAQD